MGFLAMPTAATALAGVHRVHVGYRHACQRRLVGDESPQLPKGPTVQHSPLALRTGDSAADMRQVFQRNPPPCAFRRLHDGLRETMIYILGTPPFPAAALLQEAFARLRALLLELLAEPAVACPYFV